MIPFPIVDAHVHLFDTARLSYPWLESVPKINKSFLPADFDRLRGGVAVEKIVFAEVAVADHQHLDEAAFITELAETEPRIQAMVAAAALEKGDAIIPTLERLAEFKLTRGVRRLIEAQPDIGFCLQPKFIEGVRLLPDYGFSFDICIKHWQLHNTLAFVRQCPDVPMVLDHIGKPGIRHDLIEPWWSQIRQLAEMPNVMCKISGVVTEADHDRWRPEQITAYLCRIIDVFGFDRIMFGSDWPVSELTHAYAHWVDMLDRLTAACTEEERRKFFRENAMRFYRIPD
ncbi:MAG: amidohydrolase family protein [Alphaproteobacteria bacterium]